MPVGHEFTLTPPPPVGQLNSLAKIRKEMTKLYREARQEKLDVQTATKLTFILQSIATLIRDSDLEQRIEALEKSAKNYGGTQSHGE